MRNSFKHVLVAILVLAAVVLPVFGSANSYKATETTESTEVEVGTQGVLTAVNYVDYNFSAYNDIIVWATYDDTQTICTLTGQDEATFAWWYNFLLEYNEEKGTWVVTKADMTMADSANQCSTELLGEGKMVVMFHDLVTKTQQESYDFFLNTVEVGTEFYLGVHPDTVFEVYDLVDGVFLSTVPVEVEEPVVEDTTADTEADTTDDTTGADDDKAGVNPIVIVAVVVVLLAIVGVVIVVVKRKKAE